MGEVGDPGLVLKDWEPLWAFGFGLCITFLVLGKTACAFSWTVLSACFLPVEFEESKGLFFVLYCLCPFQPKLVMFLHSEVFQCCGCVVNLPGFPLTKALPRLKQQAFPRGVPVLRWLRPAHVSALEDLLLIELTCEAISTGPGSRSVTVLPRALAFSVDRAIS